MKTDQRTNPFALQKHVLLSVQIFFDIHQRQLRTLPEKTPPNHTHTHADKLDEDITGRQWV